MTDRWNGAATGGGADPATVVDFPFPVTTGCTATPDDVGATCAVSTTANALVPGAVLDGRRAIVQMGQIAVRDGGPDGLAATAAGNARFAAQGVLIP